MTETDLYEAIAAVHCAPQWACFRDVANATGWAGARRADAIALNLYPSRGLELRGFEIKVDVRDVRRELDNPDKAEVIAKYCNTWWLVVPKGLVDRCEVPLAWGIMELAPKGLHTKRGAVPRQEGEVQPVGKSFVAAIARAAKAELDQLRKDWLPAASIEEQLEKRYQAGVAAAPRELRFRIEALEKKVDGARPVLAALGLDIDSEDWENRLDESTGKELAAAMDLGKRILARGGLQYALQLVTNGAVELESVKKKLEQLLGKVPA